MAPICLLLKCQPGSPNELLDPADGFDPLDFHAAAYVDSKRAHLPNRGANVLGIESAPEQNWEGGANFFGEPPIGARSGSTRASLRIAVNQDS
jgi:hypothetical protein